MREGRFFIYESMVSNSALEFIFSDKYSNKCNNNDNDAYIHHNEITISAMASQITSI